MAFQGGAFVITTTDGRRVGNSLSTQQLKDVAQALGVTDLNERDIKDIICIAPKPK